jgi:predicted ATPase
MLTRLYIDNYRCFVNFEYRPGRKQLIFGRNGSGKSSFMDALLAVRQFAVKGANADDLFPQHSLTRWHNRQEQTFEIEAELEGRRYVYRLVIDRWGDPLKPRVLSETVKCDGKPVFEFVSGEVHLYNDRFEHKVTYPFDWGRSAFETVIPRKDNQVLTTFKRWFGGVLCFRLNPFAMGLKAEGEEHYPNVNLSNIAAWYRHLSQAEPRPTESLRESLKEAIEGFGYFRLEAAGENARLLVAEFNADGGESVKFGFSELSDGQRCLVCLYVILHFLIRSGKTVVLDEPDNFVSLREIQPWLTAVDDAIVEGASQVLLISHHPEIINQWAANSGVRFVRERVGPTRIIPLESGRYPSLLPSEIMARGWDDE